MDKLNFVLVIIILVGSVVRFIDLGSRVEALEDWVDETEQEEKNDSNHQQEGW